MKSSVLAVLNGVKTASTVTVCILGGLFFIVALPFIGIFFLIEKITIKQCDHEYAIDNDTFRYECIHCGKVHRDND